MMAEKPMPVTARVLVTVSGTIPPGLDDELARGERPRPDYHAMAETMCADLIDHVAAREASGRLGWALEGLFGPNILLAWACFRVRRDYELIFTDGEQVGLPFAALCRLFGRRGVRHFMIVHILTVRKKRWVYRALRLGPLLDRLFVYASRQRDLIAEELGYPRDRIVLTTFAVDCSFWDPARITAAPRSMICSAGLEFRDYPTLIEAMLGSEVEVVLAAASPWSKRRDRSGDVERPENVTVGRLGFVELRQVYADARVVVVPLLQSDFQAGITTILEAMAMAKPIVCTRTLGQTDTIVDPETGRYVQPGDAVALRSVIDELIGDPEQAGRLGAAARSWAVEHADIGFYARRLADEVDAELESA
jgi:glycosyltransferase involved in cell wall biosynthesis